MPQDLHTGVKGLQPFSRGFSRYLLRISTTSSRFSSNFLINGRKLPLRYSSRIEYFFGFTSRNSSITSK